MLTKPLNYFLVAMAAVLSLYGMVVTCHHHHYICEVKLQISLLPNRNEQSNHLIDNIC